MKKLLISIMLMSIGLSTLLMASEQQPSPTKKAAKAVGFVASVVQQSKMKEKAADKSRDHLTTPLEERLASPCSRSGHRDCGTSNLDCGTSDFSSPRKNNKPGGMPSIAIPSYQDLSYEEEQGIITPMIKRAASFRSLEDETLIKVQAR